MEEPELQAPARCPIVERSMREFLLHVPWSSRAPEVEQLATCLGVLFDVFLRLGDLDSTVDLSSSVLADCIDRMSLPNRVIIHPSTNTKH